MGPRGDRKPGPNPRTREPLLQKGVSSRAPRSAWANPGARETICTGRPAARRRQALGSGGAPGQAGAARRGACSLRLRTRTPRLGGTGKGGERGALSLTAALGPQPRLDRPGDALQLARPCGDNRLARTARPPCRQTFQAKTAPAFPAGAPHYPRGPETVRPLPSAAETH